MKKLYLFFAMALMVFSTQAQITGTIVDTDSGDPLIGANVQVRGTTTGTITDIDGKFSIAGEAGTECEIEVTYLGYQTITLDVPGCSGDVGSITLKQGYAGLEEVVITGVMDIVQDRRTPVAVSTISRTEILEKGGGNTEFPEIMKNTPSIFVANQNGGFGDGQVFTRGFDQTNTAFLLNGQPINGMEDGNMYWSNWSGMADVATAVQVQRGLGSSKLAISSVGGTTNIIMKATEQERGGFAGVTVGNDAYLKGTVAYNTGMMNDKFGMSFLFTHWQGDGYADGTRGQGQNYFLSMGYKINDKNSLNFLVTGAPQWHDQNFSQRISDHYVDGDKDNINRRLNGNWGEFDNGDYLTERRNYYHKPVANLEWAYKINERSSLSTVLYGSWGRGGGTGGYGGRAEVGEDGQKDWDATVAVNNTVSDGIGSFAKDPRGYLIRGSVNNHQWYGVVSTYDIKVNDNVNWSIGADLRTYKGDHFRQIINLLGLNGFDITNNDQFPNGYVASETFEANPWSAVTGFADEGQRINYDYSERISYGGLFSQLEYSNDLISTYVQGAVSNQSHVRWDRFNYTEAEEESEKLSNVGYNLKGGASYSINNENSAYVNAGIYSRQPFHDNLFLNFRNDVNEVATNEDILGFEAGYKLRTNNIQANLNLYRTAWTNRFDTRTIQPGEIVQDQNGNDVELVNGGFSNISGINQLHQGVELDIQYKVTNDITLKAYGSLGDWSYNDNAKLDIFNDEQTLISSTDELFLEGAKVGGSAQTSFGLGMDYRVTNSLKFDFDYNYYNNNYARVNATDNIFREQDNLGTVKIPSFGILDAGVSYRITLANEDVIRFRANVNNLLDATYISYSRSNIHASDIAEENWNGINQDNSVLFGKGLTWNASVRYSF
ncbi:MAG: carboxypeptidase-like regulatory domain-containing protein [Saprospiraceae bacterium]|nr:carboxypeptidase-like regulatory domain-containing protein [Saprospiraceae bacterium]